MSAESRHAADQMIQAIRSAEEPRMPDYLGMPLPRYRNTEGREVYALKVVLVVMQADGGALLHGEMAGTMPREVSSAFVARYQPQAGGYYLADDHGHESWLPADLFEAEYTRIN